jgi:hypothetical protein
MAHGQKSPVCWGYNNWETPGKSFPNMFRPEDMLMCL